MIERYFFLFLFFQENYFICRGGQRRNHGGKIPNKISNLKQKKRKSEVREREHLKLYDIATEFKNPIDPIAIEAADWLALNFDPWSVVLDKWTSSFLVRRPLLRKEEFLAKLISTYPHYKNSHGYQLVSNS